jgi:hypothetical protein
MSDYVLIESRDPFESRGFSQRCDLALTLQLDGAAVTLFLVENAVLAARSSANLRDLEKLSKSGVQLLADDFALRERGIRTTEISTLVKPVKLDALLSALAAGSKAIWN